MKFNNLLNDIETLLDINDLREYGLSDEELLAYLTWETDLPIKKSEDTGTFNEN